MPPKSRSAGVIISPELKRLRAQYMAATRKHARAILEAGSSSPAAREADDEVEAAAEGIKKILGKQLSAAQ
jgi:hypothetical protein